MKFVVILIISVFFDNYNGKVVVVHLTDAVSTKNVSSPIRLEHHVNRNTCD